MFHVKQSKNGDTETENRKTASGAREFAWCGGQDAKKCEKTDKARQDKEILRKARGTSANICRKHRKNSKQRQNRKYRKTEKTAQNNEKDKKNVRNEITSPIPDVRMHAF